LAESAFSITGGADAAVTPLQIVSTEDDTYVGAGVGRPGDPQGPKVGLSAAADYEGILGAKVDFEFYYGNTNPANFGTGDFVEVWLKPVDWFKLDVGKFNEDVLRGKIGDDDWAHWTVGMKGKDEIFNRFQGRAGFLAGFTPIEGLYIGVLVPRFAQFDDGSDPFLTGGPTNGNGQGWRAAQVYKSIQIGAGYEIQGIGHIRAQYVGSRTEIGSGENEQYKDGGYTPARIEAAFAFTGVDSLVLDLGLKFWFPYDSYVSNIWNAADEKYEEAKNFGSIMKPFQVSLGAGYTAGDIGINARIDASLAGKWTDVNGVSGIDRTDPLILNIHLWPSYNLGFATVGLDVGFKIIGKTTETNKSDTDGGVEVGFGAWLKKSFGDSSIKGGLAYRVGTEVDGVKEPGVLSVPIVFDYSF
jgi:hypothetical protein